MDTPTPALTEEVQEPKNSSRATASRINGAKSHGPKTELGKQRSRLNAVSHGLFSSVSTLLPTESGEEFAEFHRLYYEDLAPATPAQIVLVEKIIACTWRTKRIYEIEARFHHVEYRQREGIEDLFLKNIDAIERLSRFERSLDRIAAGARRELAAIQLNKNCQNEPNENQANEKMTERTQGQASFESAHAIVDQMVSKLEADPKRKVYDSASHHQMINFPDSYVEDGLMSMQPHIPPMPPEMLRDVLQKAAHDPKCRLYHCMAFARRKYPKLIGEPLEKVLQAFVDDKELCKKLWEEKPTKW